MVEIEAGPHRISAAITKDAVEELGPGARSPGDGDREGYVGDGRPGQLMRGRALALVLCGAVALVGACGDDYSDDKPTIRVSAAASLKDAFEDYAESFDAADVSYSFAGSDELAAQIKAGARPDVLRPPTPSFPMSCTPTDWSRSRLRSRPTPW